MILVLLLARSLFATLAATSAICSCGPEVTPTTIFFSSIPSAWLLLSSLEPQPAKVATNVKLAKPTKNLFFFS